MCCTRRWIVFAYVAISAIGIAAQWPLAAQDFAGGQAPNVGSQPGKFPVNQATYVGAEKRPMAQTGGLPNPNPRTLLPLPAAPNEQSSDRSQSGSRTLGAIVSVIGSLAVVLGLFFGLAWMMRRGMPSAAKRLPRDAVDVLGRAPLAGRQQMHLVRFGNKMLLVCVSPSGVDTLGEITDPLEIDRLAGLCQQSEPFSATGTFRQMLGQLSRDKSASNSSSVFETTKPKSLIQQIAASSKANSPRTPAGEAANV